MGNSLSTKEWIDRAYKKLKGNVYFDKTQLPLVNQIVLFESSGLKEELYILEKALDSTDVVWEEYIRKITSEIDALVYPKKLTSWPDNQVIFNVDDEPIEMEKAQYYISMPVSGHILGVLWVLTVGALLDNRNDPDNPSMYEHSYGNRLRKNLYNSESNNITFSPYLFEPYFSQYESWRDIALAYAKKRLKDKQDVLILTLDLRSFFYSVHISKESFDTILTPASIEKLPSWVKRVHDFVYSVLDKYSQRVREINNDSELPLGKRVFLPIGFLPSLILSNWILTPFDEVINQQINPVYYGRYVDDIIIVDKVEKSSDLRKRAQGNSKEESKLTAQDVIEHYFCSCSVEGTSYFCKQKQLFLPLKNDGMTPLKQEKYKNKDQHVVYRINPDVLMGSKALDIKSDIQIQNDKVKVFYFREGANQALLDCFRNQIKENASEFRFLPEMDHILGKNDYSEIYKLQNDETLHKLRGVSCASLDKYSLSKFLGKYRKAGSMIRDKKENAFDRDLLMILNKRILIENYTLWERLLEIMIINDHLEDYGKMVISILNAIASYQASETLVKRDKSQFRRGLLLTLQAAVCRTSALCWGSEMNEVLKDIQAVVIEKFESFRFQLGLISDLRPYYCLSRMVNKYVLPLPIGWLKEDLFEEKDKKINLCHFESFFANVDWRRCSEYYDYFPYMVTPQEISFALACKNIAQGERIADPEVQSEDIKNLYKNCNYPNLRERNAEFFVDDGFLMDEIKVTSLSNKFGEKKSYAISVKTKVENKIKVAIGNARLDEKDFILALTGKPNRTHERYRQVHKLLKEAIEEKVDLLVLPENYLPWEWVPDISRLCANNQMALVTGVEHVLSFKDKVGLQRVYNLTAVILPYRKDDHKYAHVVYHQKVHFSPKEKLVIKGYRLEPFSGKEYQLFQWKDLWFSVYCCFELASIFDRSLFQSFADLTVAVEWNQDINYFSSIIDSLCRDLHCYCIQANSSNYGDSRLMSPVKTEIKDMIKTKGGINYTILVDQIDVDALRDFQRKEYELQKEDGRFKPTPPNFNPNIPEYKLNGTLWDYLKGLQEL